MPFDRFLIAPVSSTGKQKNLRPWLIPDDAFEELNNAYVFRGRVRKRFGGALTGNGATNSQIAPFYSRLAVNVGTTDGSGDFNATVPGSLFEPGQAFTVGNTIFTVDAIGTPSVLLTTVAAQTGTFDTTTGEVTITGADPDTDVFFYTGQPVMGLTTYAETGSSVNDQPAYAFDTQFAYVFTGGRWQRSPDAIWTGTNINFFWTCNWRGATDDIKILYVTNFSVTDPLYYFDGTTWTTWNPIFILGSPDSFVSTCRLIVNFKDRLILLNTLENIGGVDTPFVNRARWSHNGSPLATTAFYEFGVAGYSGGGFLDATTDEQIISAEFIKDRLIVYFERSTWELAFTNNQEQPFLWQKINTELGSEATFSTVPFDRHILTMGNVGVHACNGANVERVDSLIPDEIFSIRNRNEGVQRVAGIRDYYVEMVYWTFPASNQPTTAQTFPNKVLVYNYRNGAWALNDDCITVFGYFNQQIDATWASSFDVTWEQSDFAWSEGTEQAQFRQVIAGNQQGYVFIVDSDLSRNAPVMQITNLTVARPQFLNATIINHNLQVGEFIAIENAFNQSGGLYVPSPTIWYVDSVTDEDHVVLFSQDIIISGTYAGGGSATRVSKVNFLTKQFNPYVDNDRNVYVAKVDFGVLKTSAGEIAVDYRVSSADLNMFSITGLDIRMGDSILQMFPYPSVPFEQYQSRLWHPVYFQSQGEFIQFYLYYNFDQMQRPLTAWSDFEMEGMVLYTRPTTQSLRGG